MSTEWHKGRTSSTTERLSPTAKTQHGKPHVVCGLQKIITPTIKFPKECNLDDTQDNELKIVILNMWNEIREDMNKCWNGDQESSLQRNGADMKRGSEDSP